MARATVSPKLKVGELLERYWAFVPGRAVPVKPSTPTR